MISDGSHHRNLSKQHYSEFDRVSDLFNIHTDLESSKDVVLGTDSGAIVPVPPLENTYTVDGESQSRTVAEPRRSRCKELVRMTDLGIQERHHFREVVRRTRMIYDSLRLLATVEDNHTMEIVSMKKTRGDLIASNMMKSCGLWLNRDKRIVMSFKPMFCVSLDISNGKENVPVRLFNDIDGNNEPLFYEYLAKTNFPPFVFHQSGRATGCGCVGSCGDGCFCSKKNGGGFPYNQNGILLRGKHIIFECGPFCWCSPHCQNRVTQKGLKNRLELFRSRETGWGVRSLDLIQAGAFICEYTGVVLTREQAQILSMNGDSLIYPNRFSERWAEWGDLSLINSNYKRPSYPSLPPLDFALDVSRMRNVAFYMSHSSTPNVLVQFVLYDHNNLMFPHIMLFAMESIPPMRELSIDYGVADEWTEKLFICN